VITGDDREHAEVSMLALPIAVELGVH